jgi:hypothetical protein
MYLHKQVTQKHLCNCKFQHWIFQPLWAVLVWGRISQGTIKPMMDVMVMEGPDGTAIKGRVNPSIDIPWLGPGSSDRSWPW